MANGINKNTYQSIEEITDQIIKDGNLIQKEKDNVRKIVGWNLSDNKRNNEATNNILDGFSSSTDSLRELFIRGISFQDREFLQKLEEYHDILARKKKLKKDGYYSPELKRASGIIADYYLKGVFNPNFSPENNPMGYSIPELLKICRFIEKEYFTPKGTIDRGKYREDYFANKPQRLRDILAEKYYGMHIPEEQIPAFLAIFDENNEDSMVIFDNIMMYILNYTEEELLKIIKIYTPDIYELI